MGYDKTAHPVGTGAVPMFPHWESRPDEQRRMREGQADMHGEKAAQRRIDAGYNQHLALTEGAELDDHEYRQVYEDLNDTERWMLDAEECEHRADELAAEIDTLRGSIPHLVEKAKQTPPRRARFLTGAAFRNHEDAELKTFQAEQLRGQSYLCRFYSETTPHRGLAEGQLYTADLCEETAEWLDNRAALLRNYQP